MSSKTTTISERFFKELKQYNGTNFRSLSTADLSKEDPKVFKSFSSVITRYFIFLEKHPEISPAEAKMLYFQLRIDLVARYFAQYPVSSSDDLRPFQRELELFLYGSEEESA